MDRSERIAQALADMFRCIECDRWLPLIEAARDIRQNAEDVAGVQCLACEGLDYLLADQWPGREVA